MDLYKYSFVNKTELIPTDDLVMFNIRGGSITKHNGRSGSYVTPYYLDKNYSVQFRLSISYSPNFRYELDSNRMLALEQNGNLEFLDNIQVKLGTISQLKPRNLPRTWPAFSYFGGAREVFIKFPKNSQIPLNNEYTFQIPGRFDFYHADDDEEVKLAFLDNLWSMRGFLGTNFENAENIIIKITQDEGIAFNIANIMPNNINITASIAYKETSVGSFIKCWLYVWNDEENQLIRNFYFTNEAEYIFNGYNMKQLMQSQNFTQSVFTPLYDLLRDLFSKNSTSLKPLFYIRLT